MDKVTQKLLSEVETDVLTAEDIVGDGIANDEDLALAIRHCYVAGQDSARLETQRKSKNEKAQQTIKQNMAVFKPLIDRVEKAKKALRVKILDYLAPGGDLGNMDPEEVKSFGEDGLGVASIVQVQDYDYDLVTLAKHHPELLQVDSRGVAASFKAGKPVKGATPKTKLQLRIT